MSAASDMKALLADAREEAAKLRIEKAALADALETVRAVHKACTATGSRDTRCVRCKAADAALRLAGRLP